MPSNDTVKIRYVNDYQTGEVIRPATPADIERAEREGDAHTGAHRGEGDETGRTIFVDE